jgi:hypothetical protein
MLLAAKISPAAARITLALPSAGLMVSPVVGIEMREEYRKLDYTGRWNGPQYEELRMRGERLTGTLSIYSFISLAAWMAIAAALALREMRRTKWEEDELAAAMIAEREGTGAGA